MNSLFKISSVAVIALFVTTGAPPSFAQFGDLTKKNPLAKPEKQEEDKKDNDKTAANIGGAVGLISTATSSQSVEEEIAAGDAVAAMYLGASPLLKNKRAQSYVNATEAHSGQRDPISLVFGILDTPSINASRRPVARFSSPQVYLTC